MASAPRVSSAAELRESCGWSRARPAAGVKLGGNVAKMGVREVESAFA